MINQDKWIKSLPKTSVQFNGNEDKIDSDRWINTVSKKKRYPIVKKYSLMTILFVFGLLLVSVVKNETRNLEKEINNLRASNKEIKFNLDQAILDNEVITSPENISLLAKEYLNIDFITYKKSQIKNLNDTTDKNINLSKKEKKLSKKIKAEISKEIKKKKTEIRKLQALYSEPEKIPDEIKTKVVKIELEKQKNVKKRKNRFVKKQKIRKKRKKPIILKNYGEVDN